MNSAVHLTLFVALIQLTSAILISNVSVACPGEAISFTCSLAGSLLRWDIDPPLESGFSRTTSLILSQTLLGQTFPVGTPGFMFQTVLTNSSGGMVTSTLTTLSDISSLEGSMITCVNGTIRAGPLIITVADRPSVPLNPRVLSVQNGTQTSVVTLQWSPPSSPGGVDVSYVLTISPTPVSGSPVTAQSNSTAITVSYNIPYNVTIRADNCAGFSGDTVVPLELVACLLPSAASGVVLNAPDITTEGSTLEFTCFCTNETVQSTCNSNGRWSPDPANYDCRATGSTFPPVICGSCESTVNYSMDVKGVPASLSSGSVVGIALGFIVSMLIGLVVGMATVYCAMRTKNTKTNTSTAQKQPTPSGPVYEEVSTAKENIELESNQAYAEVQTAL